jgi:hypothetical protein
VQRAEEGYKRRGTIAVSKVGLSASILTVQCSIVTCHGRNCGQVDANGYYYINILGEASHKLKAVLQARRPRPSARKACWWSRTDASVVYFGT